MSLGFKRLMEISNDLAIFRLVAQCLNQQRHRPPPFPLPLSL